MRKNGEQAAIDRLNKTIGMNLQVQRELKGISQDDFAKVLDISPAYLGLIERGERTVTSRILECAVSTLKITVDSLFDKQDKGADKSSGTQVALHKEVSTLVGDLKDSELINISHTITEIIAARKAMFSA